MWWRHSASYPTNPTGAGATLATTAIRQAQQRCVLIPLWRFNSWTLEGKCPTPPQLRFVREFAEARQQSSLGFAQMPVPPEPCSVASPISHDQGPEKPSDVAFSAGLGHCSPLSRLSRLLGVSELKLPCLSYHTYQGYGVCPAAEEMPGLTTISLGINDCNSKRINSYNANDMSTQ